MKPGWRLLNASATKIENAGSFMNSENSQRYCADCVRAIRKQFARRGFELTEFVSNGTDPALLKRELPLTGGSLCYEFKVYLGEVMVGFVELRYRRMGKAFKSRRTGGLTIGSHPIDQSLTLYVQGVDRDMVASKDKYFERSDGRVPGSLGRRPRIKAWAAYAAKQFVESYMPQHVVPHMEHVHDT